MNPQLCSREDELIDALGRGYVGAELNAHVEACPACSELRLVAGALLNERSDAVAEAAPPSAGTMWWRMQMRRRRDVQLASRRILLAGQALTLMIAVGLIVHFFGDPLAAGFRNVVGTVHLSSPLLILIATWLLVAPIAGWVAIRQK